MLNTTLRSCLTRVLSTAVPLLSAGYVAGAEVAAHAQSIPSLDLLFVIDNSASMAQEQAALTAQFPKLIEALTAGRKSNGDTFTPFDDIHLGVVSSDMGLVGVPNNYPGCNTQRHVNGGDDGLLQHESSLVPGCQAEYPAFLEFEAGYNDPLQVAKDLGCIAALGTTGCGFEQPLEAGLKALWPKTYVDADGNAYPPASNPILFLSTTAEGTYGHGDTPVEAGGNGGFSRSDRAAGTSLLAIILVTDEEDCSSRDTSHFVSTNDPANPLSSQPPNLRCYYNKANLFQIDRYVLGYEALRPGEPNKVVFGAVVGVPTRLVDGSARAGIDFGDEAARNSYYDYVLSDISMQEIVVEGSDSVVGNLQPSCTRTDVSGETSLAFPPRRIVEVVKGLGEAAYLDSICRDDFTPVVDHLVDFLSAAQVKAEQR